MRRIAFILMANLTLFSCTSENEANNSEESEIPNTPARKQLNINILWDLSDRIDPTQHPNSPEHYQRDIEIIKYFTEYFKKDMDTKGAYSANGKIKVFFTPPPADNEINSIAKELTIDLSSYNGQGASKEKKKVYDNITSTFVNNATKIYQLTVENNQGNKDWPGSDIWRFFKENVETCIIPDTSYRNILVILTDGYIYHKESNEKEKNRTSQITPSILAPFRNNQNWKERFNEGDYGLINPRNAKLDKLEVLVLEVNSNSGYKKDEDYITAYLDKWFDEMGVRNKRVYTTDLTNTTVSKIQAFMAGQ